MRALSRHRLLLAGTSRSSAKLLTDYHSPIAAARSSIITQLVMTEPHSIRQAIPDEASYLSELAFRSKAHWGYSQSFLDSCRAELAVDPERIGSADYQCFVAANGSVVMGFYTVVFVSEGVYELEALFVEPKYIGTGVGRSLIQHAISLLSEDGAKRLVIQGDPNASRFYLAAGAQQIGTRESGSVPGRFLPLFQVEFGSD